MGTSRTKSMQLVNELVDFALRVRTLLTLLPRDEFSNILKYQILRSVTSPAFNYGEAQSAESKKDFIHKMGICLKELRETHVGLLFIERGDFKLSPRIIQSLKQENNELISIFVKSINTAKQNLNTRGSV
jgi:four helix bundle protein